MLRPIGVAAKVAPAGVRGALDSGAIGVYRADNFRLADGDCRDCPTIRQALWYFRGDTIAVPRWRASAVCRDAEGRHVCLAISETPPTLFEH